MTMGKCKHGEFELTKGCPQCIAEEKAKRMAAESEAEMTPEEREDANVNSEANIAKRIEEAKVAAAGKEVPRIIVKVRYYSETTGEASGREYSYFSIDPLALGDKVHVPVRDRIQKAIVTGIDVPESEIAAFRDQVKTIHAGSKLTFQTTEVELPAAETPPVAQVASLFGPKPEPAPPQDRMNCPSDCAFGRGPEGSWDNMIPGGCVREDEIPDDVEYVEDDESLRTCPCYRKAPPQEEFKGVPFGEGVVATSSEGPTDQKPPALVTIETQVGRPFSGLFQLYQEAASLLQVAKKRVIATNEDLKPATDDLAIIATCKKAMFARKTEIVEPFKSQLDAINQAFGDLMFPVMEADRLTRGQVTTFDNEQRRKAAEAKRIEDEKLRLAKEEETLTGEHTVELGTAQAPPPVPERTRTDMGTLGGRSNWKARVVDFALLPDEYKLPNESKLNSHARTTKGTRPIPGVEFYDDRIVTMRTRGN